MIHPLDLSNKENEAIKSIGLATIGFTEVHLLSITDRVFNMGLFVIGIGVISYIASHTIQLLSESNLLLNRAIK